MLRMQDSDSKGTLNSCNNSSLDADGLFFCIAVGVCSRASLYASVFTSLLMLHRSLCMTYLATAK